MTEVNVSWMIDCMNCGLQVWSLDKLTDEYVRVQCKNCDSFETYSLSNDKHGATCMPCNNQTNTWNLIRHSEERHQIILECEKCKEQAEIWLRDLGETE